MNECNSLGGLLFLLFLGVIGAVCFITVRNIEKQNNKQPEKPEPTNNKKAYGTKAHIGSKVCVERKVGRTDGCGYFDFKYKAELGIIVGKRKMASYGGFGGDIREFWLVQFEDGEVDEYGYDEVYTEYSEELVNGHKTKRSDKNERK